MNAFKKGSLQVLSIRKCLQNAYNFSTFLEQMKVSEQDHENIYGEKSVAASMTGTQLQKSFTCGLTELYISNGVLCSGFNLQQWLKYSPDKRPVNTLGLLLTSGLRSLELSYAGLTKQDADLLGLSLSD